MPETDTPVSRPDDFVALAERLAAVAGDIVLRHFRRPIEIERKADESPVTLADREAEAAMRALIAERFPDHGVVGEEQESTGAEAEYVWVVDPIDGTKRFISGHVQFGTLIGLLRNGAPLLGVIDMPAMGERWIGVAGRPTTHRDRNGTREARVRPCTGLDEAILFATSPHMFPGADFDAFERVRTRVKQPMYGGECYAYGLLALGFVDLVIEDTMGPYDYLPLVAVIEGAGGIITDWHGRPLGLDSDGRVLAAGDAGTHTAAIELLNAG
jgi:inositol-phosphate phosphatase/L-galactose 1-phosphate phosphatase/histidinol-phosphatase